MKNKLTIGLICLLLLASCNFEVNPNGKVIISKSYTYSSGKEIKPCVCLYMYKDVVAYSFQDSCNKYQIGDTIK